MDTCKICQSNKIHIIKNGVYDDSNTIVYECENCGVQFLHPFMKEEEEQVYYNNYYKSQLTRYTSEQTNELISIQTKTYNYYFENKLEYEFVKKYNSLLEIGSGSGGFIKFLKNNLNYTKNISVIEKSQTNVQFLKESFGSEINVYNDFSNLGNLKFDIIIGFMVFEHLRNPIEFLDKIKGYLNKGGVVLFEIPNQREPLIKLYNNKDYEDFYYQKQHYYVYSETSIEAIANKVGLEVDHFYYNQNYGLDNHLSWNLYHEKRDFSDLSIIIDEKTNKEYKKKLIDLKSTDTIGIVFKIRNS